MVRRLNVEGDDGQGDLVATEASTKPSSFTRWTRIIIGKFNYDERTSLMGSSERTSL